jgi:hypothetical protein
MHGLSRLRRFDTDRRRVSSKLTKLTQRRLLGANIVIFPAAVRLRQTPAARLG